MKKNNKLLLAFLLAGIAMTTTVIAQTTNYVPKWSGTAYVNTVTPIFEDATHSRIGIGTTTPSYILDVNGEVNAGGSSTSTTSAYRLGTNRILWHNGNTADIFVGVNAGNATMTGHNNTLIGNSAGNAVGAGHELTFIGFEAGKANTAGYYNTAVGYQALHSNINQYYQTAIGYQSLYSYNLTSPSDAATNTACGYQTLYHSQAYGGCAFGFWAALHDSTGCSATAFGEEALRDNTTGDDNVAVGAAALHLNISGQYNTAVGDNAGAGGSGSHTANNNSFFGHYTGQAITTGSDNAFMGRNAGFNNSTGSLNTFMGDSSGYTNTTGNYNVFMGFGSGYSNTTAAYNTFIGDSSGYKNTTGYSNSFVGHLAGYSNTTGRTNAFFGDHAAYSNTTGTDNSALGDQALYTNTTGSENTALGLNALYHTTTGSFNTATGMDALFTNSSASFNTADGYSSLGNNTTGTDNTAVGYSSLAFNNTGFNNTAVGYDAGFGTSTINKDTACTFVGFGADANGNYNNAAAYGNGAIATGRNKFMFGNSNVIGLYTTVGIFATSDGRFKTNVTEDVKGLEFINKLRPVTYNLDTKKLDDFVIQNMPDSVKARHQEGMNFAQSKAIVHSGFIAQEVEKTAKQVGLKSSIVSTPSNSADPYALNYAEFVVPLVKAVQELSKMTDSLKTKTAKQDSVNKVLQNQITALTTAKNNSSSSAMPTSTSSSIDVSLKNGQSVVLDQNVPNPFAEQTVINYFLPDNTGKAQMLFYNSNGNLIQSVELTQRGKGQLNVFGNDLTNGIYTYTLVVDGKVMDTKKMAKQ